MHFTQGKPTAKDENSQSVKLLASPRSSYHSEILSHGYIAISLWLKHRSYSFYPQCLLAPFAITVYSIATLAAAWVSSRHPDFQSMPNSPIFPPLEEHTLPSVQKDIVHTLSILLLDY